MIYTEVKQIPSIVDNYYDNIDPSRLYYTINIKVTDRFSVTGAVYEKARNNKKVKLCSGCIHDILRHVFPEFESLIRLHLSELDGKPMYALENGFHLYAEGVNADGTRKYFSTKEEKEAYIHKETQKHFNAYMAESKQLMPQADEALLLDVWNVYIRYNFEANSPLFNLANKYKHDDFLCSFHSRLVVKRKNEALASHLRISLEEAKNIPSGLTEEEFNERYILANIERWKNEANRAINLLDRLNNK